MPILESMLHLDYPPSLEELEAALKVRKASGFLESFSLG